MILVHHQSIDGVWYAAAIEGEKIWATAFASSEPVALQYILESLPYDREFQMAEKSSPHFERLLKTLYSIYLGEDISWNFQLEMQHLSNYAEKVLSFLSKVPVGYVTAYQDLARVAGGSSRAVGRVMAMNPFPLLVPCHRVVHADFTLGGFGMGGAKVKRELLKREDKGYKEQTKIKVDGNALAVFPVRYLWKN